MYIEASDHACPHLREQRVATEARPVASPPQASCPFGAGRAVEEPVRPASRRAAVGGWWAFAAEARAMTATA